MVKESKLQSALARGLQPGGKLEEELFELEGYAIESIEDAQAVCDAIKAYANTKPVPGEERTGLHALASLLQDVNSDAALDVFTEQAIPVLRKLFANALKNGTETPDDFLFLLKIFALYQDEEGAQLIVEAARKPMEPDSFVWAIIMECIDEEHPQAEYVCEALRFPLPENFIAVSYLDFLNRLALMGTLEEHPFDTPDGVKLLESWITSQMSDHYSYAQSATTALPFIDESRRGKLLELAMKHEDEDVQLEASWSAAHLGNEVGITNLAKFCLDPHHCLQACDYLRELERDDAIPEEALDPTFQAMAEMCSWLAHPQEFGDYPDEIELIDTREMFWPPTNDQRQLWLFKYQYEPLEEGDTLDVGVGMVGAETFSLFDEATATMPPEDIYALHVCWELEINNDPRAPAQRSVEEGRKILMRDVN